MSSLLKAVSIHLGTHEVFDNVSCSCWYYYCGVRISSLPFMVLSQGLKEL